MYQINVSFNVIIVLDMHSELFSVVYMSHPLSGLQNFPTNMVGRYCLLLLSDAVKFCLLN